MPEHYSWYNRLTPKEREVLEMYARKHSYKAVASALGKSSNVVDQQLLSVRRKMGVSSMAEAMYKLAERDARLGQGALGQPQFGEGQDNPNPPVISASPRHGPEGLKGLRLKFAAAITAVVLGLILVILAPWHSNARAAASLSADDLKTQLIGLKAGKGIATDQVRAVLVGDLCDKAWQVMWGPDEDHVLGCMTEAAPEIREAFEWSKRNDPNLAIRIVGNGHRLFSRVASLADWPKMLDDALGSPKATLGLEYGRALCGVAFAHWSDAPKRGYNCARKALAIFEQLPHSEWDQANALRHMGLCCTNNARKRLSLYHRALDIFERIGDDRGKAHAMLSIAQAGGEDDSRNSRPARVIADQLSWAIRAADLFRLVRNENMLNEAIEEVDRSYGYLPYRPEFESLHRRIRSEFATGAAAKYSQDDVWGQLGFLAKCLRIDVGLRDISAESSDIEQMTRNPKRTPVNPVSRGLLVGYLAALGPPLSSGARQVVDSIRGLEPSSFARGMMMTPGQAVLAAQSLAFHR